MAAPPWPVQQKMNAMKENDNIRSHPAALPSANNSGSISAFCFTNFCFIRNRSTGLLNAPRLHIRVIRLIRGQSQLLLLRFRSMRSLSSLRLNHGARVPTSAFILVATPRSAIPTPVKLFPHQKCPAYSRNDAQTRADIRTRFLPAHFRLKTCATVSLA
jgi:hypothetical protein